MVGASRSTALSADSISSYATPGTLLAGKYRVERILGRGGMAVVVAAKHLQLRETVAVKLLHPHVLANPRAIERFLREARVTMRFRGEHVARVYDAGALPDQTPFVVMESLDGADLGAILRERGRLPVGEATDYVLQACEALAEAHALGVVHRDLKPANLFLTTRVDGSPSVKVLDFGVSKILRPDPSGGDSDAEGDALHALPEEGPLEETAPPSLPAATASARQREADVEHPMHRSPLPHSLEDRADRAAAVVPEAITMTHAFLGSPKYCAPEQLRSARDVDARADVWALGVILHELVNGVPPFRGDNLDAITHAILTGQPARFVVKGQGRLESLLAQCLAKDRGSRFASVRTLAEALEPFASGEGRLSVGRIVRMDTGRGGGDYPATAATRERRDPRAARRARLPGWRWAAVAAGAGAVGFGILARHPPSRPAVAPEPSDIHAVATPAISPPISSAKEGADGDTAPKSDAPPGPARPPEAKRSPRPAASRSGSADPLGVPGGRLFDTRR